MKHNPETPGVHYNAWTKIKDILSSMAPASIKKLYVQSQMVIVKSLLT